MFQFLFGVFLAFSFLNFGDASNIHYKPEDPTAGINYVHVVFMNHLDVGFDGICPTIGYAINVVNKYFDVYFPRAAVVAQQLREKGGVERLIYTTHPWLVAVYLDCENSNFPVLPQINESLHCPNETMLQLFLNAVQNGDITWHAFPFNGQAEIMDPSLFTYAVSIAHNLDDIFSKNRTITMSQRDVPGMTRSVIPLLRESGVQAITVGVNGATAPPGVPSAFVWEDPSSGQDILAMWHPGGYGGIDVSDCVIIPGLDHTLAFYFRSDNAGPPESVEEVIGVFQQLEQEFPNAIVMASTYDSFVTQLMTVKDQLPIVTAEIGDTWIHGIPSDPLRVAMYRAVLRLRTECIEQNLCNSSDPAFERFNRMLVKVAEHTWGLDVKTFLDDWVNWANADFEKVKKNENYLWMIYSWIEQRQFLYNAVELLGDHPLASRIVVEWQKLTPRLPSTAHYHQVSNLSEIFDCGRVDIGFDPSTGGISYLVDKAAGNIWASQSNPLAQYLYQTFTHNEYMSFFEDYMFCPITICSWAEGDFGKPNVSVANPIRKDWSPSVVGLWQKFHDGVHSFLVEMKMDPEAVSYYGAAEQLWMKVDVLDREIKIEFQWFNKTPTRLPEAHWLVFNPVNQPGGNWQIEKLGELVDPTHIQVNGSFHLHAVNGAFYNTGETGLAFTSHDATVISVGAPYPFPTPLNPPDYTQGFAYNLYNNIWGTNWIMWYPYLDEDYASKFRFSIVL